VYTLTCEGVTRGGKKENCKNRCGLSIRGGCLRGHTRSWQYYRSGYPRRPNCGWTRMERRGDLASGANMAKEVSIEKSRWGGCTTQRKKGGGGGNNLLRSQHSGQGQKGGRDGGLKDQRLGPGATKGRGVSRPHAAEPKWRGRGEKKTRGEGLGGGPVGWYVGKGKKKKKKKLCRYPSKIWGKITKTLICLPATGVSWADGSCDLRCNDLIGGGGKDIGFG